MLEEKRMEVGRIVNAVVQEEKVNQQQRGEGAKLVREREAVASRFQHAFRRGSW